MGVVLEHLAKQDEFFNDQDTRPMAFVGGLGTGKTMTASDKIMASKARYPFAKHFIFSNSYDQLISGTLHTFFERLNDVWIPGDHRFEYKNRVRYDKTIVFPKLNNAIIEVRSVDQDVNWKSLEISFAWIDEAQYWEKSSYDRVIGRLRGTTTQRRIYPDMPLQAIITANPPHTRSHWLYELTHEPDPLTGEPPIKLYTATTYDNPFLPEDYLRRMESAYDPDIARAELLGEFIDIGRGKVFRRFSREKHVFNEAKAEKIGLPPLKYDQRLPLSWSHDYNLDPLASVLFQFRRVNLKGFQKVVMFVYDCMRIESALISDAPKELVNRKDAADLARRNGLILYGDASGASQSNRQTGISDCAALRQELHRLGFRDDLRVSASNPLHVDRAAAANRQLEDTNGDIGVVIVDNPNNRWLMLDLEKQAWKPGTTSFDIVRPKPGEILPNSAKLFHLADAWSYPIFYERPYETTGNKIQPIIR